MVAIIKRMRKLRELLWIRIGPGALILPKEVRGIAMEFHEKIDGGSRGAKKFWREILPRIKYRNPAVPISITRHSSPNGPVTLKLYTASPSATSASTTTTPPTPAPTASTSTAFLSTLTPSTEIPISHLSESRILAELIQATNAEVIEPSEKEKEEVREMEEFKKRSEIEREKVREKLMRKRREQEALRLARGDTSD